MDRMLQSHVKVALSAYWIHICASLSNITNQSSWFVRKLCIPKYPQPLTYPLFLECLIGSIVISFNNSQVYTATQASIVTVDVTGYYI